MSDEVSIDQLLSLLTQPLLEPSVPNGESVIDGMLDLACDNEFGSNEVEYDKWLEFRKAKEQAFLNTNITEQGN